MNILVGNPALIALLQQTQVWLTSFIMSFSVVYLLPDRTIQYFMKQRFNISVSSDKLT